MYISFVYSKYFLQKFTSKLKNDYLGRVWSVDRSDRLVDQIDQVLKKAQKKELKRRLG